MEQRQIKFRAWDPERKLMLADFDQDTAKRAGLKWGASIHLRVYETGLHYGTLSQYTGLKDSNGVEIYEGDILKHPDDPGVSIVKFDPGHCGFRAFYDDGFTANLALQIGDKGQAVVIGNQFENPELLKAEGEG